MIIDTVKAIASNGIGITYTYVNIYIIDHSIAVSSDRNINNLNKNINILHKIIQNKMSDYFPCSTRYSPLMKSSAVIVM